MKHIRYIIVFLFAGLLFVMNGCGTNSVQKINFDYKTISPPENGWTIEELTNVTYLCGVQLSCPPTMEALGNHFRLEAYNNSPSEEHYITAELYYDKTFLGYVTIQDCDTFEEITPQSKINSMSFERTSCQFTKTAPVLMNGIRFGSSKTDAVAALGEELEGEYTAYRVKDVQTETLISGFIFDEEGLSWIYLNFPSDTASEEPSEKAD